MAIIDFHSHILPDIDDGSRDLEHTLEMLRISAAQGVDTIVATPHFYAWQDRIDRFLERRDEAAEEVMAALAEQNAQAPQIYIGAEVAFFEGISDAKDIDRLAIGHEEGGSVMLLEMPFHPWKAADIEEIADLIDRHGLTIVLAHLERYFGIRENKRLLAELLELPLYIQINAESLTDRHLQRKVIKLFAGGQAHLLGSDCHGVHRRPPNLGEGRAVIEKKLGLDALARIDQCGSELLGL